MSSNQLRRGFKSQAERLSLELREELGLTAIDRLDPRDLAAHLAIPIQGLGDLETSGASAAAISHFQHSASEAFSALTLVLGHRRLIVVNDGHALVRQASSLAHELAHICLEHEPHRAAFQHGCRPWNNEMETQADWLGGALLVPRDGALQVARNRLSVEAAASHFGVSEQMMKWRLAHTGAVAQARRERARM